MCFSSPSLSTEATAPSTRRIVSFSAFTTHRGNGEAGTYNEADRLRRPPCCKVGRFHRHLGSANHGTSCLVGMPHAEDDINEREQRQDVKMVAGGTV